MIPFELGESIIVSLCKDKDLALEWRTHRGLKLLDHVVKVKYRWQRLHNFIRQQVCIDEMQFGFMLRRRTSSDPHRLQRNDRTMIRWMSGITPKDQVSSHDLPQRTQLDNLEKVLYTHRLRRNGHVKLIDGWLNKIRKLNPGGGCGRGRQHKTWSKVIRLDCLQC